MLRALPPTSGRADPFYYHSHLSTLNSRNGWRVYNRLHLNMSDFDINGVLGTYPLHLFSTAQLSALLAAAKAPQRFTTALDVGAGAGNVTKQLAPLVASEGMVSAKKRPVSLSLSLSLSPQCVTCCLSCRSRLRCRYTWQRAYERMDGYAGRRISPHQGILQGMPDTFSWSAC
jgi:hypothetical protein